LHLSQSAFSLNNVITSRKPFKWPQVDSIFSVVHSSRYFFLPLQKKERVTNHGELTITAAGG
jgi:hypothetical protein